MNLWFRLLAMLLRRPWRRPVDPFATTVVRMRVWPTDLDLNRHVTNGRYFTMADLGRMDFVLRTGAWRVALRHRAAPIVGDAWGKFRKELKPFQAFDPSKNEPLGPDFHAVDAAQVEQACALAGAAFDTFRAKLQNRQQALDAEARKTLVPVKHTLTITVL